MAAVYSSSSSSSSVCVYVCVCVCVCVWPLLLWRYFLSTSALLNDRADTEWKREVEAGLFLDAATSIAFCSLREVL